MAQQLSPVTAEQAVAEALDKNISILAERQNVPIADARLITAAIKPNPRLSLASDYMDWLRRGLSPENSAGPSEWSVRMDYILEGGKKRERRIEVAQLVKSVAELRLVDSIRLLTYSVQNAVTDLLAAKEALALAQQNLKVFNDIFEVNSAKVRAGELAGVELIRTRVARQQFENAERQAQLKVTTAKNNLQFLMGRMGMDPGFDVAGSLRSDPQIVLLDELKATALEKRPDLLAQRKDAERLSSDIRLQVANGKIDYTFGTAYQNQYTYSNGRLFGLYLTVPLPIYDRNQGEVARAQRETKQAETRSLALEASIRTEVENAWQQYNTAKNLLDQIQKTMLEEARQVREITEYSYRRGEASFLEFLDAQRAYNDAIQSYNDARADYTRSLYLIDSVTGRSVNP